MKKIALLIISALILTFSHAAYAADVTLQVVVPDAWVSRTSNAVLSKPMCTALSLNAKKCAEYLMAQYLKSVVVDYDNRVRREQAEQAQGYTEIIEDDIPLEISQ